MCGRAESVGAVVVVRCVRDGGCVGRRRRWSRVVSQFRHRDLDRPETAHERQRADGEPEASERVRAETDPHDEMEGLYIKVESEGQVVGRYKYVRASFLTSILESGSHWLSRPIVPNQLAADVDIFA